MQHDSHHSQVNKKVEHLDGHSSTQSHKKSLFFRRFYKNLWKETLFTLGAIFELLRFFSIALIGALVFIVGYIKSLLPSKPPKVPSPYLPPLTPLLVTSFIVTFFLVFWLQV